jgi:hypothetical protein
VENLVAAARITQTVAGWLAWLAVVPACASRPSVAPVEPLIGLIAFEREITLGGAQPVQVDVDYRPEHATRFQIVFPAGAAAPGTVVTVRWVIGMTKTLPADSTLPIDDGALQIAPAGIVFAKAAQLTIPFGPAHVAQFHALTAREEDAAWTLLGEAPLVPVTNGAIEPIAGVSVTGSGLWTAASYGPMDAGLPDTSFPPGDRFPDPRMMMDANGG